MRRNHRQVASLAAGLLAIGLLTLGCADNNEPTEPGVANIGPSNKSDSSNNSSTSQQGDPQADMLAYSKCMRNHGIEKFPDPDANGGIAIDGGQGLDPQSPEYKAADEACKSLMPPPPSDEEQAEQAADSLKYAKCMREQGIENFPDPNAEGGINIQPGMGFDPESPKFKAADKACQHLIGGDGKRVTSQQKAGS